MKEELDWSLIYSIISITALLFIIIWNSNGLENIIINLGPEIIGIIFTYKILENIIKKAEEERIKPYKLYVFEKIYVALSLIIQPIYRLYVDNIEDISVSFAELYQNKKSLHECLLMGAENIFTKNLISFITQLDSSIEQLVILYTLYYKQYEENPLGLISEDSVKEQISLILVHVEVLLDFIDKNKPELWLVNQIELINQKIHGY